MPNEEVDWAWVDRMMEEARNQPDAPHSATNTQGQAPSNEHFQAHHGMMMMPPTMAMPPTAQHTTSVPNGANHFGAAMAQPRQGGAAMNHPNQGAAFMSQPNQGGTGVAHLNQGAAPTNHPGHGAPVANQQRPDIQQPPAGLDDQPLSNSHDPLAPSGSPPKEMPHSTQEGDVTQADTNHDGPAKAQGDKGSAAKPQEDSGSGSDSGSSSAASTGIDEFLANLDPRLRALSENWPQETVLPTVEDKEPDQASRTVSPQSGLEPEGAGQGEENRTHVSGQAEDEGEDESEDGIEWEDCL